MLGPHGGRGGQKRPKIGPHGLCMTPNRKICHKGSLRMSEDVETNLQRGILAYISLSFRVKS